MLPRAGGAHPSRIDDLIAGRLLARLERLDLRSRRVFAGKLQGERRSKRRGRSVEFDDYRLYTPGDDLRFIDWNVYARFDRLFIKLFLEEEDLALHIVLDASASMDTGQPNKLEFAARLALALACVGLVQNNRVGLTILGLPSGHPVASRGMATIPDLRGRRNIRRLGQFLLDTLWSADHNPAPSAPRAGESSFSDALTTLARHRAGKGVMVLLSDFFVPPDPGDEPAKPRSSPRPADPAFIPTGGYERGLRALAAAGGYDTFCLQVLSPGELEPERESERGLSGDLRLTDIESGAAVEVTLTPALIRAYKRRLAGYCDALHSFALAREMTHLLIRSDEDLESLMLDTLRRQGLVG